jgi:hypothetical protein
MSDKVINVRFGISDGDYGVPFDIIGTGGVITEVQNNHTDVAGDITNNFGINCWGKPVFRVGDYELDREQAQQLHQALGSAITEFDRCRFSSVVGA